MKSATRAKQPRSTPAMAKPSLSAWLWPLVWTILFAVYFVVLCLGKAPIPEHASTDLVRYEPLRWIPFIDLVIGEWYDVDGSLWLSDRLPIVAGVAFILAAAASVGRAALAALGIAPRLTWSESLTFSLAAGLNILSLATLLAGLAGLLHLRWLFIVPLAFAAAGGAVWLARAWRMRTSEPTPIDAAAKIEKAAKHESTTPEPFHLTRFTLNTASWLLAILFGGIIWVGGMLPPCEFDVREYHLQAPKEFYLAGRIDFLPYNVYANMPLGSEMPTLLAMVICDDWRLGALIGKSIIAIYAIIAGLGLYAVVSRLAGPTFGRLAAALYLSIPWVYNTSTTGLIEGPFALYVLTSWYAVWLARDERASPDEATTRGLLSLAGWLAGSAVACKYPAVLFVVLPLVVWIVAFKRSDRDTWGVRGQHVGLFVLLVALACGAWLAKNAAKTGNPVYPLLYSVFDGATRTPEKDAQWRAAHSPANYDPLDFVHCAIDFLGSNPWQSLLLAPLAALALYSSRPIVRPLAIFVGVDFVLWWLFTHRVDRFWTPFLPLWTLLAAFGLEAAWNKSAAWRWLLPVSLTAGVALCLMTNLMISGTYNHNRYFAKLDRLWNDTVRFEPWHHLLDARTQPGEAILFVGDAEPFDLEARVLYNTVFDDGLFEQLAKGRPPQELHAALQRLGVTHVFVSWHWINRYRDRGNYGFSPFITRELFIQLMNEGVLDPPIPAPAGTSRPEDQAFPVRKTFKR